MTPAQKAAATRKKRAAAARAAQTRKRRAAAAKAAATRKRRAAARKVAETRKQKAVAEEGSSVPPEVEREFAAWLDDYEQTWKAALHEEFVGKPQSPA